MLRPLALGLTALLAAPAVASAGTFEVRTCSIDGTFGPNRAWVVPAGASQGDPRFVHDTACNVAGEPLRVRLKPGSEFPPGRTTYAALRLTAPAGTTIADYALRLKHFWFAPGAPERPSETTYTIASYGSDARISGTGLVDRPTMDRLASEGRWFGYRGDGTSQSYETPGGSQTFTRADSTWARGVAEQRFVDISAGCFDRADGCSLGATATVYLNLVGSRVTIRDAVQPTLSGPAAGQGLLQPGLRAGDEPVVFSVEDNVGVKRAELVDAASGEVLASEDYAGAARTESGAACDFSRPAPCPDLRDERLASATPLAGRRSLLLRITDAADNVTQSAPFEVVGRGGLNGSPAAEAATLAAGFPTRVTRRVGGRRVRVTELRRTRTVSFGRTAVATGRLVAADGRPVAGARVDVRTRLLRLGSTFVPGSPVITGPDGGFAVPLPAGPSRQVRLEYRTRVADPEPVVRLDLTMAVRGRLSLRRSASKVRPRGAVRFSGRLAGGPVPPRGVAVELQAYERGRGWRTIRTVRSRRDGSYRTTYRFNAPRGRFAFRLRLRPSDAYPYARAESRTVRVRVG